MGHIGSFLSVCGLMLVLGSPLGSFKVVGVSIDESSHLAIVEHAPGEAHQLVSVGDRINGIGSVRAISARAMTVATPEGEVVIPTSGGTVEVHRELPQSIWAHLFEIMLETESESSAAGGLQLTGISEDSGLFYIGLRSGDALIRINEQAIGSPADVVELLKSTESETANLIVLRDGREEELRIKIRTFASLCPFRCLL